MHDPTKMLVGLSSEEVIVLATEMMLAEDESARQWQHVLSQNYTTEEDYRMDFAEELEIIQRDVFAQPEKVQHFENDNIFEDSSTTFNNNSMFSREKDVWWPTLRLDKELGFLPSQSIELPLPSHAGHETPRPLPTQPPDSGRLSKKGIVEGIRVSPEVGELIKVNNDNSKPGIIRLTLSKNLDKYRATELSSKIKETGQEEGSKGKKKSGYVRLIIQNDEISLPSPKDPMFSKSSTNRRKFKQIDGNVIVLSSEANKKTQEETVGERPKPVLKSHRQKRDVMNNAERIRRNEISAKFRELAQMIPQRYLKKCDSKSSSGLSKIKILDSARQYYACLETTLSECENEVEREKSRNLRLQAILHKYKVNKIKMQGLLDFD